MLKNRVVIADEHMIIRRGVMSMITGMSSTTSYNISGSEFIVSGDVSSAPELLKLIAHTQIDILFMGYSLAIQPGTDPLSSMDGIMLIKWLNRKYPDLKIVVLSPFKNSQIIRMALEAGAKGYISRDTCEKTLNRTLTAVANGEVYIERQLMKSLFSQDKNNEPELSPRETDVLRMLCKGLSLSEIAKMMHLSNKTVSAHKLRAMSKLGVNNDCQLYCLISKTQLFDISI